MPVGDQISKVIRKIGTLCTRLSDSAEDYLDIEVVFHGPAVSQYQSIMQFIRKFSIKYDTIFENGNIIQNSVSDEYYLVASMVPEQLLNSGMNNYGMLYVCNAVARLDRVVGYRDNNTMEYVYSGSIVEPTMYGCLVTQKIELVARNQSSVEEDNRWFYTSADYDVKVEDTIQMPTASEKYKVDTIDRVNLPGCLIIQAKQDTRI